VETSARADHKSSDVVVESRSLYPRKEHRGDNPKPNRRRDVTPDQKQRIRELYAETGSGYEVARIMGLGRTTVYNHLELGKGKKPRWTDDENQVVVDGYIEGRKVADIAKAVGRSKGSVVLHMHRHRKKIREDPKKRRVMGVMTRVLKVMRKADIFREVEI